jgi:hypothetical protein
MISGVNDSFLDDNNLHSLAAIVTFDAATNFKVTVDYPRNFDAIVSAKRPARARNNYGELLRDLTCGGKLYKHIISYGSGCGATSVGTTYK